MKPGLYYSSLMTLGYFSGDQIWPEYFEMKEKVLRQYVTENEINLEISTLHVHTYFCIVGKRVCVWKGIIDYNYM